MAGNLDPWLEPFFFPVMVTEILLILFACRWFNERSEVTELLRPLILKLYEKKKDAAQNGHEHVPPIGAVPSHLQRRPSEHDCHRRSDENRGVECSDWNVQKPVRPFSRLGIESQEDIRGKKSAEEHYFRC